MSDKKRIKKTPEQIAILEDYDSRGMTSYGRDNLPALAMLSEVVAKTNLTIEQVKVRCKEN